MCGRGLPVVLVHGFTAEGILYAQTLSRLVAMGFKVVAIDVAGHGATRACPRAATSATALLKRVLDELGIRRAVFAGHSMGGRLVTQLTAADPQRAVAVVLIDAAVGECWDRLVRISRFAPPVLVGLAALLVADTLSTLPLLRNPAQAAKLGRLVGPTLVGHARPWRMLGPAVSMMRSRERREMLLDAWARPRSRWWSSTATATCRCPTRRRSTPRAGPAGTLVTVKGGTHSWVLKDPRRCPPSSPSCSTGRWPGAGRHAGRGRPRPDATPEQVERAFLGPTHWCAA